MSLIDPPWMLMAIMSCWIYCLLEIWLLGLG
jgi:hypothetical protein